MKCGLASLGCFLFGRNLKKGVGRHGRRGLRGGMPCRPPLFLRAGAETKEREI